jgi:hypothetical protein
MFCPSCGKEIPDESRFCLACGKNPSAVVKAEKPEPERQSHGYRNFVLLVFALIAATVGITYMNGPGSGGPFSAPQRDPLTPSSFAVNAGQMRYFQFTVNGSARVVGRFQASGGNGNDIEAVLTDADDFENWRNGHAARALYQSGKTTVGSINVPISQAGAYYLAFNNRFALLSTKTISAEIVLHH